MQTTFTNTKLDKDFMSTVVGVLSSTSPKKPVQQLNEKLTSDQQDEVEYGWNLERPKETQRAIDHVFKGKTRIEIPFQGTDVTPHPDVEEHLNNHGYVITDYFNGWTKDKYNRKVALGKALTNSNASPDIKAAYDNDPNLQSKDAAKSNLKIVISHRPVDVAGMTSGHQSWVNTSCLNFETGIFRHYLPSEVEEGTHVAYLTDENDHDLDRPIARIAVKPFHSETGHTIFRPEGRSYPSDASSSFRKNVHDWFDSHYPAEEGETYRKNKRVYDDDGEIKYTALTEDAADRMIESGKQITGGIPKHVISHITDKLIKEQKENPNNNVINSFMQVGHRIGFDRNQVNALYKVAREHGQLWATDELAEQSGDVLNKQNLQHALDNDHLSHSVYKHRYLPQEFIDKLPVHRLSLVHPANIKPHHLDKVVDNYIDGESGSHTLLSHFRDKLSKEHLIRLANEKKQDYTDVIRFADGHPNTDNDVMAALFNGVKRQPHGESRDIAMDQFNLMNKNPTPEHVAATNTRHGLGSIMENATDKLTHALAFHKSLGLEDRDRSGRLNSIRLGGENSDKFLTDDNIKDLYDQIHRVRSSTISNQTYDRLLQHSMQQIEDNSKKLHPSDMFDEPKSKYAHSDNPDWVDATSNVQEHMNEHARLIDDNLDQFHHKIKNDEPFDQRHFESLGDHIYDAQNHRDYDDSHDDVVGRYEAMKDTIDRKYGY